MQLTARQAYIDILTELVKEEAPTLYLEDYLYYFNKAISEYMKTRYEVFETNQQLADDIGVLRILPGILFSRPMKSKYRPTSENNYFL
jgi:hypothetical protein